MGNQKSLKKEGTEFGQNNCCPRCQGRVKTVTAMGELCQTCEICGYQPPSVTSLGIQSTDEQYE